MDNCQKCRLCEHWRPLFRGDYWGVRSFVDAPLMEQRTVLARIAAARADPVTEYESMGTVLADHGVGISDVVRFDSAKASWLDWPMWGDCAMTELDTNVPERPESLARAIDGSNFYAILRTHAHFGCSQWTRWQTPTVPTEDEDTIA